MQRNKVESAERTATVADIKRIVEKHYTPHYLNGMIPPETVASVIENREGMDFRAKETDVIGAHTVDSLQALIVERYLPRFLNAPSAQSEHWPGRDQV